MVKHRKEEETGTEIHYGTEQETQTGEHNGTGQKTRTEQHNGAEQDEIMTLAKSVEVSVFPVHIFLG